MQSMLDRFPRIARLNGRRVRAIPFVPQLDWADCGAAALASVLGHCGKGVALDRVRSALAVSGDGVTPRALLDAARQLGLAGRSLEITLDQLAELPRATILRWEPSRYVVFDRMVGDAVRIVDPATGERDVSLDEVSRCFAGVALELRPRADLVRDERTGAPGARSYLRELFAERAAFTRVVVMSLIMRVFALALPLITGLVIDWVVPRSDRAMLGIVLVSVVGIVGVQAVCTVMRAQLLLALRTALDGRLTLGFLDHLVSLPIGFFQRRSAGDLMMRVGSNATIRELITSQSLAAVVDGAFVAIYAIVILAVNPRLGLLAFGLAALELMAWLVLRPKNRRYLARDVERQARAQGYLVQLLAGMETLKCAGAEATAVARYAELHADCLDVSVQRGRLGAALEAIHGAMSALAPMVILVIGASAVIAGSLSLGTMLAMSALATSLFGTLAQLVQSLMQLQVARAYTERIDDVRRTTPEQDPDAVLDAPTLAGAVSLRSVSLRYGDGPLVVDSVTLDIPPGSLVALVGATGSGKTSLLNLIAGIVPPTRGTVAFDGRPLAELDLRAVRRQIGVVPQHPYIFGATIRDNIALTAPHASLERIQRAAAVAALDADLAQLPMGLDTPVSDGGTSLSGGQRQRIAIARAALREPSLLLLDEATSALDGATEAQVAANLSRLRATRVVVAHRLSTVASADLIVVMDQGRIAEIGNHASLLAQRGVYHRLVMAATRGAAPANPEIRHAQAHPLRVPAGLLGGPRRLA